MRVVLSGFHSYLVYLLSVPLSKAYIKHSCKIYALKLRFDICEEHITMKLLLLFCFLVQTNAFRVPLPYGTGVASSGQGKGHQGIWTRFADDNFLQQVQGN